MKNMWTIAKITALLIVVQVVLFGSMAQVSAAPIRPCIGYRCLPPFSGLGTGTTVNPGGMEAYGFTIQTGEVSLGNLVGVMESVGFQFTEQTGTDFGNFFTEESIWASNNLADFPQGEIVGRLDYLFSSFNASSGYDNASTFYLFPETDFNFNDNVSVGLSVSKEVVFSNVLADTIVAYSEPGSPVGDVHTVVLLCDIPGVDVENTVTSVPYNPVPLPGTLLFLGFGLLGYAGIGRKRAVF